MKGSRHRRGCGTFAHNAGLRRAGNCGVDGRCRCAVATYRCGLPRAAPPSDCACSRDVRLARRTSGIRARNPPFRGFWSSARSSDSNDFSSSSPLLVRMVTSMGPRAGTSLASRSAPQRCSSGDNGPVFAFVYSSNNRSLSPCCLTMIATSFELGKCALWNSISPACNPPADVALRTSR